MLFGEGSFEPEKCKESVFETQILYRNQAKSTDSLLFSGKRYRFFAEIRRVPDGAESVETLYATRRLVLLKSSLVLLLFFLKDSIENKSSYQKNDQV